ERTRTTRLLRSTRITRLHRYYQAVRPCAPHRYSASRSFSCLRFSLGRLGGSLPEANRRIRGDRFPRFAPEPEPGSRHLHAGHHLGSKQVSPRLLPKVTTLLGFDAIYIVSTRHQWFTYVRLPGSHLTRYPRAFSATRTTPARDRRSVRLFEASSCTVAPEGQPPSLSRPASVRFDLLHRSLLLPSWRTVIAIPKASHPDHVVDNRAALELHLTDEDLAW